MHFTFLNWISEHPPRPINRRCANKLCAYGVFPILVGNNRGSLVILSEAKDLSMGNQMLRYAQHDMIGFGRYSS